MSSKLFKVSRLYICKHLLSFLTTFLATPSPRCYSVAAFQVYLHHVLAHKDALLEFYGSLRWRRLRWKSHINRTKAYDELCQRVTGGDPETVVAFGDGRFSSSSRGHAPGPVKTLYRELKRRLRGRMRKVDEFRTSIVCSKCRERMDGRSRFWALKVCKKDTCLVSIAQNIFLFAIAAA